MSNDDVLATVEKVIEEANKSHATQMEKMRERMIEKARILNALHAIRLPDVEVPTITETELRWGTTIKVKNVKMFPVLQKILGCTFEHYDKQPIGDGRKKMVRVSMVIKGNNALRYDLQFQYERKLGENDKCKVVTETVRQTRVVCKI